MKIMSRLHRNRIPVTALFAGCFFAGAVIGGLCCGAWYEQAEAVRYRASTETVRQIVIPNRNLTGGESKQAEAENLGQRFCKILWHRVRQWVTATVLGLTVPAAPFLALLSAGTGISFGWILTGAVRLYGAAGIFWILAAGFPHFCLLLPVFSELILHDFKSSPMLRLRRQLLGCGVLLLSAVLESGIHPFLMKFF